MSKEELHQHQSFQNIDYILDNMPSKEEFKEKSNLMSFLSDGTRLSILWILLHSEECVYNIAKILNISSSLASTHLRGLKNAKIIVSKRHGKEVYYRFSETKEANLIKVILKELHKETN